MKRFRTYILSPSLFVRSRLARILSADPRFEMLGQNEGIPDSCSQIVKLDPEIVFVAQSLCQSSDFKRLSGKLATIGIRHIEIVKDAAELSRNTFRRDNETMPTKNGMGIRVPMVHPNMSVEAIREQCVLAREFQRQNAKIRDLAIDHRKSVQEQNIVVIGASTGGVDALSELLVKYPSDCPPTAIVQHTGQGFSESLVRLLDRHCAARVLAARSELTLRSGMVCVAAGSKGHMRISPGDPFSCTVTEGPMVSGHMPSVDALFNSVQIFAPHVIGVLLTGMGRDGADGLLQLRKKGCVTIGQDAASSTVYGMPRVAADIGATSVQLHLDHIADEIMRLCGKRPLQSQVPKEQRV